MYNLTNITAANTMPAIMVAVNDLSAGALFSILMMVLFILYLIVMKKQDFKKVFLAGSFFLAVVTGYMYTMGLIELWALMLPIMMLFAGVVMYKLTQT